jgi:hypothetical protein
MKVVILAKEASRYSNISDSIKAMIFFGTPYGGSDPADPAFFLASFVRIMKSASGIGRTRGRLRPEHLQLLRPKSKELIEISLSFAHRTKDLDIMSFYEERFMGGFKNLVRKIQPYLVLVSWYLELDITWGSQAKLLRDDPLTD